MIENAGAGWRVVDLGELRTLDGALFLCVTTTVGHGTVEDGVLNYAPGTSESERFYVREPPDTEPDHFEGNLGANIAGGRV